MENGLNVFRCKGGHTSPIDTSGFREQWKKVQKKEAKKHTSLKIKRIIPLFNPSLMRGVYSPPRPSPETSFHHADLLTVKRIKLVITAKRLPYLKKITKEVRRLKADTLL